jgi:16S rRNA (uracil1498-N3)-methyltransferase
MQLFYIPEIAGSNITLSPSESKHAIKVLRLVTGDTVRIIDGRGGFYKARIVDQNYKKCTIEIIETQQEFGKRDFHLHIAIAPTKNIDRLEWFIEKATEIGIDEITPLLTEHSERKIVKPERLEKIIISAIKQSIKAYKPKLNEMTPFSKLISTYFAGEKYIAHCYEEERPNLINRVTKGNDVLILIGPEGDFSPDEVRQAWEAGFTGVSLGESRLRTETAGVVACHIVNLVNE